MLVRLILFASSYSPLFLILAVRFQGLPLRLTMGAIALASAASLALLLLAGRKGEPQAYDLKEIKDRGAEVAGYIATYILPLIVLNQPTKEDFIGYAIFILISGLVYIQSGMVNINPVVYLFGRRISTIRDSSGTEYYVIHRGNLSAGEVIWASNVLSSLLIKRIPALR